MAPRTTSRNIGAEDGCATPRTHWRILSSRCVLRSDQTGPRNGVRAARARYTDLRVGERGGKGKGVPGRLKTKGLERSSAALSKQTTSNVVWKGIGDTSGK